ncbi:MAG: hypoxanthine phosphoribosyltransferase [Chitinophagales bacterium]|nr:hypoxanthine phosphoribosyltransferase [Chitinophagales bacterium]
MIITVKDKQFAPYLSEAAIHARIAEMGKTLTAELKDSNPLFISILNGAFIFAADLIREIDTPCEISFVKLASYHGTESSGEVKTLLGIDKDIKDRVVVIVEDIVDTGNTLSAFMPTLEALQPKKILLVSLLFKPKALQRPLKVDYTGFEIPNDFIVGYGLDYDGYGRNLKDIYKIQAP